MSNVSNEIAVQERKDFGKNASRRARKGGQIPASVYSKGKESKSFLVDADAWKVLTGHHGSHMVTLKNGDAEIHALIKEVQFNYLKNYVYHIDFQEVDMDKEIVAAVPVHAHGESVGAAHGGILEQELHELEVICRPADLPEAVTADVTKLDKGEHLCVKDLVLPQGVRTEVDGETIVFHVGLPKEEAEAPAEEAPAEPEAIKEKKADEK